MTSRIVELKLHLRVPGALEPDVPRLRAGVERTIVVGVIEELERRLHAALGERAVIRVRHLASHWTLDASTIGDAAAIVRLADELAHELLEEIEAQPAHERLRPRSPSVVAFASEPHVEAARLADLADGTADAWFHAGAPDGPAMWEAAAAAGAGHLEEVVGWLDRMGYVEAALELAPARALAEVAAAMPARASAVALVEARRAARLEAGAARLEAGAARREAGAAAAPAAWPTTSAGTAARAAGLRERRGEGAPDVPAPAGADSGPATAAGSPAPSAAADETGPVTGGVAPAAALPAHARPAPPGHGAAEPPASAEPAPHGVAAPTRYAGLFYLIGRVLELDLAEALWATGVPEGDVLAHVGAAIVDDDGDPAWRWFGGAFDRVPLLPVLPAWAISEVAAAVQHGLGRRLVAFGVTRTPAQLGAELDGLAEAVQRRAAGEAATARVVARSAAALAVLVAARLRRPPSWPLLREVISRPGRMVVTPDAVRVIMSAALVEIEHRRAGLDHDPGHAPWLGRRVVLEFVGGEAL